MNRKNVFFYIEQERTRQDRKWGGIEHDKHHSDVDWANLIKNRVVEITETKKAYNRNRLFIEIAALATAALEAK